MSPILIAIIGTFGATLVALPIIKWIMGAFDTKDTHMTLKQNFIWAVVGVAFVAYVVVFNV